MKFTKKQIGKAVDSANKEQKELVEKYTPKCEICGKKATHSFSPDCDIRGLGSCLKHKTTMSLAYIILTTEGKESYNEFINSFKHGK